MIFSIIILIMDYVCASFSLWSKLSRFLLQACALNTLGAETHFGKSTLQVYKQAKEVLKGGGRKRSKNPLPLKQIWMGIWFGFKKHAELVIKKTTTLKVSLSHQTQKMTCIKATSVIASPTLNSQFLLNSVPVPGCWKQVHAVCELLQTYVDIYGGD